jgi:hypothetical protein
MSARADLCGGRSVMIVPTATSLGTVIPSEFQACRWRAGRYMTRAIPNAGSQWMKQEASTNKSRSI